MPHWVFTAPTLASATLAMGLAGGTALAAPCADSADQARITGVKECLVLRTYRSAQAGVSPILVVVIHGDVSSGGPATYHFAVADRIAKAAPVAAVALIRPGYEDGAGGVSGGSHNNRRDHYTAANIDEMAGAIANLRARHRPGKIVLVGHSGGAATAGVILGRYPGLAQAAVLVACPCDVEYWRVGRGGAWPNSLSPDRFADKVPAGTRVIAVTGSRDTNTQPSLARAYVAQLVKRGIDAKFVLAESVDHNAAFTSGPAFQAMLELAR